MNKRIAGRLAGALGLLLALCLLGSTATPVLAFPQMPHQFWGTVTIGGSAAPAGTVITARITGAPDATTTTGAGGSYNLMVPADDPDTPAKDGGVPGDIIQFLVGTTAAQTSTFAYGGITNLPLTIAAPPPSAAQKLIGADDAAANVALTAGYVSLTRFQAVASGNVVTFKVKSDRSAHVKVAIYEDSSGNPGALLKAVDTTGTLIGLGWNDISIDSATVNSGAYYWLAINSDTTIVCGTVFPGGTVRYKAAPYAGFTFPNSADGGYTSASGVIALMAGWGIAVAPEPPTRDCTRLTFKWNAATGATTYRLQVNTSPGFAAGTSKFDGLVGNVTSREVTGLPTATTYYWRVRAENAAGESAWSTPTGSMRCE